MNTAGQARPDFRHASQTKLWFAPLFPSEVSIVTLALCSCLLGRECGAVPGTVPNGFVREMGMADRPGLDLGRGDNRAPYFRTSEPWLIHNLFYLLAVSELNAATQSASH
jgi:hypothetical protein